jgi:AcrR family transcriptional regulator
MPRVSPEHLRARKRGIVLAAARCLQRNGLQETGMRDLFRAANLSPGAVYRYFASKEELVAAVAARTPTLIEAALAATERESDPGDRLRPLLEAVAMGLPPARLQLELEAAALRSPIVAAALAERRKVARQALAERWGAPGNAIAPELVEITLALCDGLARSRLLDPEADLTAQVEAATRWLATLSRPRSEPPQPDRR